MPDGPPILYVNGREGGAWQFEDDLDQRFWTIRRAYLRGHLTLRETTALQNHEVWLRRSEREREAIERRGAM